MRSKILKFTILVFICSASIFINNQNKKIVRLEEDKTEILIENHTSNVVTDNIFNVQNEPEKILTQDISFSNPVINEKIADISQKYTDVDKYFYVNKDTTIKTKDNNSSKKLCDVKYGTYIHCIGEDIYNSDGFYKIEIDNKIGFISVKDVTMNPLFKIINKKLYAKEEIKAYNNYETKERFIKIEKLSELTAIGYNKELKLYEIKHDNKKYYVDENKVSKDMLFNNTEKLMYCKDSCKIYTKPDISSEVLKNKSAYSELEVVGFSEEWAKVKISKDTHGYIKTSQLTSNCPRALKAVNYAYRLIGTPYVYGGTSPRGTDCSGMTYQCYQYAGITIPRTSYTQNNCGRKVSYSDAKPGDLITWADKNTGKKVVHVGLYVGDGMMIHSASGGVQKTSIWEYKKHSELVSFVRVIE